MENNSNARTIQNNSYEMIVGRVRVNVHNERRFSINGSTETSHALSITLLSTSAQKRSWTIIPK